MAALVARRPGHAQSSPTGIWIDHTGRGAVEITECGANLCGRLVWLKDSANKKGCGVQIIGNARPVGKDTWDGGWILDPEKNEKYSVELKPIGADKLRVLGYMGSKLFSETMIWKRAAVDLERCDASRRTPKPAAVDDTAPKTAGCHGGREGAPARQSDRTEGRDAKGKADRPLGEGGRQTSDCKRYVAQIGETISVPCEK